MARTYLAPREMINDVYSASRTYAVGDYCIYNNVLYKCKTDIETAEEFNSAKWTATTVMKEMGEEITQAEYDALSDEDKANNTYYIKDSEADYGNAGTIDYSNTTSGLKATNVQAAIDEISDDLASLTKSALSIADASGTNYTCTVTNNKSYVFGRINQTFINAQIKIVATGTIAAGESVTLGTISENKPAVHCALATWMNVTSPRRWAGYVGSDGSIIVKPSVDLEAGTYYLYISCAYTS